MITRNCGLIIPVNHPEYNNIKSNLDRSINQFIGDNVNVQFYKELNNRSIVIPRFYPIYDDINDKTDPGFDIDISSKIIPRNKRQEKSIDFLKNNNSGILQLEPASGKTVISIKTICDLRKKSLILVHKRMLRKQWRDEFIKHTNLKEDDISFLTTTKYEKDLKKPIIIATVQTLLAGVDNKDPDKRDQFINTLQSSGIGVCFMDECHTVSGAMKFSYVSLHINAHVIHGLSATPERSDGQTDIIRYHLGDVTYFEPEENELLPVEVYQIYFPFGIYKKYWKFITYRCTCEKKKDEKHAPDCWFWSNDLEKKFDRGKYLKQMIKVDSYFKVISGFINKFYKKDRTILVLGDRVNSLIELAHVSNLPKEDVGVFIPSAKDVDKQIVSDITDLHDAFHTKKVVFSTYGAARDGNSRDDLDSLFLTTPCSNIIQAIGRVQRWLENKKTPMVVDFVDTEVARYIGQGERRKKTYESKGWKVKVIKLKG